MSKSSKRIFLGIVAIILVFAVFYVTALNREIKSESANEEPTANFTNSPENPQARDVIEQISLAFEQASGQVSPAVVSIFAEQIVEVQNSFGMPDEAFRDFFGEDLFRRFFGAPQPQEKKRTVRSLGSGVIVTKDGYILTNNHVVEKAEKLSVVVGDKNTYEAKVIGTDPPTDVAVIKIEGKNLPVASLGNSDSVKIGQWVIAVGNPFQLMHTVTAGIISAKGRSSVGLADYEDFIQTDASINPGNSGGALADLDGNVVDLGEVNAGALGRNLGKPYTDIPDPFGCCDSYGDHFSNLIERSADRVPLDPEIERACVRLRDAHRLRLVARQNATTPHASKRHAIAIVLAQHGRLPRVEVGQHRADPLVESLIPLPHVAAVVDRVVTDSPHPRQPVVVAHDLPLGQSQRHWSASRRSRASVSSSVVRACSALRP